MALTRTEHELLGKLTDVMRYFVLIAGDNEATMDSDLREVASHVHALQNMVLAQSAAREYPSYRPIGGR